MKKFFKILMICLCIIPCALVMCACGKKVSHVSVDVEGDYTSVASENKNLLINQLSNLSENSQFDTGVEFYSVLTYKSDLGDTNIYLDGKMKGEGENIVGIMSATIKQQNSNEQCNYYIYDNKIYISTKDAKIKQEFDAVTGSNIKYIITVEQLELIISNLQNTELKQAISGNDKKYKLTATTSEASTQIDYEIYFIYTNNTLTGLRYKVKSDDVEIDLQMIGYNGQIDLPNLDGFLDDPDYGMN